MYYKLLITSILYGLMDNPAFSTTTMQLTDYQWVVLVSILLIPNLIPAATFLHVKQKYPYKLAFLSKGKRWCLKFQVWDLSKEKLVNKREWVPLSLKTDAEKEAWAEQAKARLNQLLIDGYVLGNKNAPNNRVLNVYRAAEIWLQSKVKKIREDSMKDYQTTAQVFADFIEDQHNSPVFHLLEKKDILAFLDHLTNDRNVGATTRNNYLTRLKIFFADMQELGFTENNPCKGITKLRESPKKNMPYTDAELRVLLPYLREHDFMSYVFVNCIYYCFIRVTELRKLRVENFDLINRKIFLPSDVSKNLKNDNVDMPYALCQLLESYGINKAYSSDFVFTIKNKPGEHMMSKNVMAKRFAIYRQKVGIRSKNKGLYSFKPTGVCKLYMAGVDLKSIQRQLRHHSLDMTDKYLRELGLYRNDSLIDSFPPLES